MATKSQEILLKGNTTNASAVPSSLKVREIAINTLDRSLFTNDGNSIVKLYTGTTKWFDVNGNANNALKLGGVLASEYINKEAFNSHINNSIIHITADERIAWNNKWDYNEEIIKGIKVNAAVLSDSAKKLATARKIWGKSFDGSANVSGDLTEVGNITASGKATIQGDIVCGGEVVAITGEGTPAGVTDYSALTGKPQINGVTLVSGNNTLAALGIQAAGDYATNSGVTTLLANYADKTFVSNNYVGKAAFNNHTADTDIHITAAERAAWNAKWDYNENTIKAVKVTSASSADKLNSSEGTSTVPIYFKNGKPAQCIPSDLFSGFDNAYSSTETSLGITIAGHTRMVVVAYSQTAGSVAWSGITDKPTTFAPSAHTHTASEVSGLPTSLKNPYALTFGSKTYDGSAAATITASDLGALTAHQSIYALTLQVNSVSQGTYNPASAAKTINIAVPTKTSDITNDSGFITSASIPTALKNPYAVEIKANGVSLGTYDGSAVATFNLSAANVGAANKVHTHAASDISGLPTKLSSFTNDVGYITGITKSMVEGVLTGDITSHTHSYLPLSGGTLTDSITLPDIYITGTNSKLPSHYFHYLYGGNNVYEHFGSPGDSNKVTYGHFRFFNGNGSYKTLYIGGDGSFAWDGNNVLDASNYNFYAPTLTGTGASGTWGISISGNAASATNAINADKLANIKASTYFKNKDCVFNSEWGATYLWTIWDNHLYAADKRFAVTLTGANSTNFEPLFDGNFESSIVISSAQSVLHIKHTTAGNVWSIGLPYGSFYVVFYNSDAENVTGRVYCNYAPQGIGWHTLGVTHIRTGVWKLDNDYYQLSDLEITITKPTSSANIHLCQILHEVNRSPGPNYAAVMSKYCNQKTNYTIEAAKFIGPLQGNANTATKLQTPRTIWGQSFDGSGDIPYTAIPTITYVSFNKDVSTSIGYIGKGGSADHLYFGGYDGVPITLFSNNKRLSNNLTVATTGNVLIGTLTDNGYKLQVNGSERVYGDLIVDGEVSALVA